MEKKFGFEFPPPFGASGGHLLWHLAGAGSKPQRGAFPPRKGGFVSGGGGGNPTGIRLQAPGFVIFRGQNRQPGKGGQKKNGGL